MMANFSDYIVYVDESGDHGLVHIDPEFPVFCLTFCIVRKKDYYNKIVPEFQRFKFDFWGHDGVVLHETDIRKSRGPFALLMTGKKLRESFYDRLNGLMEDAEIKIFASVIDKPKLTEKYPNPWSPYEIALLFCMETSLKFFLEQNQEGKTVHVIFESRGKKEDDELELEFRRICDNERDWGYKSPDFTKVRFEPLFVKKAFNSTGLQLADLTARPIAIHHLRPAQDNRAYNIIREKYGGCKRFP